MRLALGTYRMGSVLGHAEAMAYAVKGSAALGSALRIDTAPTYEAGASERLVGAVLREVDGDGACHVTTKVGVVDAHDAEWFRTGGFGDAVELGQGGAGWHCLDPAFIRASLERSAERLGRAPSALLLHNPELHLTAELARFAPARLAGGAENPGGAGSDDALLRHMEENAAAWEETRALFLERLERAFAGMSELVSDGLIESYGVSSNVRGCRISASGRTPPLSAFEAVSLAELLDADSAGGGGGFSELQIPLNVCEPGALLDDGASGAAGAAAGASALDVATARGVHVTLNRVLHALPPHGVGYGDWGRNETFLTLRDAVPMMPAPALFRSVLRDAVLAHEPEVLGDASATSSALWRMSLQSLALWTAASAPGVGMCLVGARTKEYIDEMLTVAALPRLAPETVRSAFVEAEAALRELTPRV